MIIKIRMTTPKGGKNIELEGDGLKSFAPPASVGVNLLEIASGTGDLRINYNTYFDLGDYKNTVKITTEKSYGYYSADLYEYDYTTYRQLEIILKDRNGNRINLKQSSGSHSIATVELQQLTPRLKNETATTNL